MKRLNLVFIVFSAFCLLTCNSDGTLQSLIKLKDLDLILPGCSRENLPKYFHDSDGEYLVYFKPETSGFYFFNLASRKITKQILLDSSVIDSILIPCPFFVYTADSILLLAANNTFYFALKSGLLSKPIKGPDHIGLGIKDYVIQDWWTIPIHFDGRIIYASAIRIDIAIGNKTNLKDYYSTPQELQIDISQKPYKYYNYSGVFPDGYIADEKFYYDLFPQRCVNNSGGLIYGFSASDTLTYYPQKLLNNKVNMTLTSEYSEKVDQFPFDSLTSFSFIDNYLLTQDLYKCIIYDPFRELYYRIVEKGVRQESKDGLTRNVLDDKPWSILILDKNLKQIDEFFFDPQVYSSHFIIPSRDGLLVSNRIPKEINETEFQMSLSLFAISVENEKF